jgi:hypothetical protein
MRPRFIVSAACAACSVISMTQAAAAQPPLNTQLGEPPRGAGTEAGVVPVGNEFRVREGVEVGGYAGIGYGVGLGGRAGYAFRSGVYAGGAFTFYTGNASFLGGELGYKFFATERWELRPYLFAGPAFVRVGDSGFGRPDAITVFGFQPGFLGAYRFGPAFISAELRTYVTPNPGSLAFLGGAGVAL